MLSPWFGEFMGTLVLILLGDGVVAGRPSQEIQSRKFRVDGHYHRMGICGNVRHLHCGGLWEPLCPP